MLLIWLGLAVGFCVSTAGNLLLRMDTVIEILSNVECHFKGSPDRVMAELHQELGFCTSNLCRFVLGPVASRAVDLPYLSKAERSFFQNLANHTLGGSQVEHGVVLTPDGTTVSVSHLLAGIAAGLKVRRGLTLPETPWVAPNGSGEEPHLSLDPLVSSTISTDLGLAFLSFHAKQSQVALGPNGCWDSVSEPRTFTLMGPPSCMPDAVVNGAMDGFILGTHLAEKAGPPPNISALLNDYYGSRGLGGEETARSNFRRKSFAALLSKEKLREQVENALRFLWRTSEASSLFDGIKDDKELAFLAKEAVEEFTTTYVECPAIVPRCMWGARPYKGTPVRLKLPLGFVYIHHTSTPSEPCRNFSTCAADMRSMQRFHQDFRGWDDIGYSFVFGSDGYLYQGRGWHRVGAHTRGYNSKGYGVSFIGDYMKVLPAAQELELMKHNFIQCALRGARLQANYTIHGHRQMVPTLCPGDRLFQEIETWEGFKRRCFTDTSGRERCI